MSVSLSFSVNGKAVTADVDPRTLLVEFIRNNLALTGTHVGCDTGQCGACTVHMDGGAVRACSVSVADAAGRRITTIEGLHPEGKHPLQLAWTAEQAPQCGYCQPGQIMKAAALLADTPDPSDAEIVAAMDGNICRCGTYQRILAGVRRAVAMSKGSVR